MMIHEEKNKKASFERVERRSGRKETPKNTWWNDKTRQQIPGIKHEPEKMSVYGSYAAIIIK